MMDLSEQGMAQRPRGGAFGTHYPLSHDASGRILSDWRTRRPGIPEAASKRHTAFLRRPDEATGSLLADTKAMLADGQSDKSAADVRRRPTDVQ
jgi:hypothetical protein